MCGTCGAIGEFFWKLSLYIGVVVPTACLLFGLSALHLLSRFDRGLSRNRIVLLSLLAAVVPTGTAFALSFGLAQLSASAASNSSVMWGVGWLVLTLWQLVFVVGISFRRADAAARHPASWLRAK